MCGIAGIVDLTGTGVPPREALLRMAGALRHRGPDEFGLYRDRHAGLAHARLSIIDLSTGHQPLANEDETLWIVFNGEIFNFLELRDELEGLGHRFRTKSDTEVIVHAYEAWGEAAFARLNGQWAAALWDSAKRRLLLTRDAMGVHPLYLCEHRGRLYFASEVKAIFSADASIPRALDPLGLDETFTFWTAVPPQTIFSNVEELRPGHVRIYDERRMCERAYCVPNYPEDAADTFAGSIEDAVAVVRARLERAVSLRMLHAEVPVGSYLSGGLDSSLVAALGQRFARGRLQTFSLRFADGEYDETAYQRLMAQRLASDHYEIVVQREDIARVFPDVVFHAERPVLRTAPAPLFLLSRLVRQHGTAVVLTGEGADEVFGGYDLFREGKIRRFWARHPSSRSRPRLLERLYPYLVRSPVSQQAFARQFFGRDLDRHALPGFAHGPRWRSTATLKRLFSRHIAHALKGVDSTAKLLGTLPEGFQRWSALAQDQHLEISTLLSGYLLSAQGDRMLMAHSVEGRFPFLDRDVVALASKLPASYKIRALDEKHVLKKAARGIIADEIVARQKQPYRAPDALSFAGQAPPEYVEEALSDRAVRRAGVFDPAAVSQMWRKCKAQAQTHFSNSDNMALVGVLSTQILHRQFVESCPNDGRPLQLNVDFDRLRATAR